MKKNKLNRTTGLLRGAKVDSIHPLVGAWKQEPNPVGTTTVIYTVFVKNGKFGVVGSDGEEGTALENFSNQMGRRVIAVHKRLSTKQAQV